MVMTKRMAWASIAICAAIAIQIAGHKGRGYAHDEPAGESPAKSAKPSGKVDFAKDVRPLFEKHCYECHGPKKQESGYRLDVKAAALKGGDVGRAIVPGKSSESLLIQAVTDTAEEISQMPAERSAVVQSPD